MSIMIVFYYFKLTRILDSFIDKIISSLRYLKHLWHVMLRLQNFSTSWLCFWLFLVKESMYSNL